MSQPSTPATGDRQWLGHPRGLVVLFFAEMWERFSFYGMRALLVFYLTKHFLFERSDAYLTYGTYQALVYVAPVIGGVLADRFLGARKAVIFGAVLLVFGHLSMAIEGPRPTSVAEAQAGYGLPVLYLSLALIIAGVGFLKSNISTIVGSLYGPDDPRRDSGFTLFYVGINTGAWGGSMIAGAVGEIYGWSYGFGLAGLGMIIGLFVFTRGQATLGDHGLPPDPARLKAPLLGRLGLEAVIYLGTLIAVFAIAFLIQYPKLVGGLLIGTAAAMLVVIAAYGLIKCDKVARDRLFVATLLTAVSVLFWALFEQAGSSLNVYTMEHVDRFILGVTIPATVFQSLNPIYIMLFGSLFSMMWTALAKRGWEPSTPMKFALALVQVGLGYLVLVYGAKLAGPGATPVIFIFLIYLLHTTGELCLSPVGLSMVTKLVPTAIGGMMMGTWFLATAGADFIAGLIAQMTAGGEDVTDPSMVLSIYQQIGLMAVGAGLVLALATPWIRRRMHGIH